MNRARGFTLMEVMISLTILSMMMVAIVSSLRTFANTKVTVEEKTRQVDQIRLVSGFLRRSIGSALPSSGGGGGVLTFDSMYDESVYFSGEPAAMTWIAPFLGGGGGGVYAMHLSVEENRLALRWQPYQQDVSKLDWSGVEPRTLMREVEEYSLGYRSQARGEWQEQWDGALGNPASVRITIKAGGKYWPELVVRLD